MRALFSRPVIRPASSRPFTHKPTLAAHEAVADARDRVFWLDRPERPAPRPSVAGDADVDLLVVGGGFSGLWAAIEARRRDAARSVLVVEGGRIAHGASGRNGGFVSSSLTHGLRNGHDRWPDEMPTLLRLGKENLAEIESFVSGWDCGFHRAGEQANALTPEQEADARDTVGLARSYGLGYEYLDAEQARSSVHSPLARGALWDPDGVALVDPARLAWGLASAAEDLGASIAENTPVRSVQLRGDRVVATTDHGRIAARRVAIATSAFPPLLRRLRNYVVPVYDYVLVTEPLSAAQRDAVGWQDGRGLADLGNQFHYSRTTDDGRILWGGYDAVYHPGNGFGPALERERAFLPGLAQRFLDTFPQLAGIRFSHAWGGAIDTCSRFTAFWGTAHAGRTAYSLGFTGLGVGSSRFGAEVMLDLLEGDRDSERLRLQMVRTKPLPFPPEPLRSLGIAATVASLRAADGSGRRNLWLRTLDRLGMGFDS